MKHSIIPSTNRPKGDPAVGKHEVSGEPTTKNQEQKTKNQQPTLFFRILAFFQENDFFDT